MSAEGGGAFREVSKEVEWEVKLPKEKYWIYYSPKFPFEGLKCSLQLLPKWSFPDGFLLRLHMQGPVVSGPLLLVRCHVGVKSGDGPLWTKSRDISVEEEHAEWREMGQVFIKRSELEGSRKVLAGAFLTIILRLSMRREDTVAQASTQTEASGHSFADIYTQTDGDSSEENEDGNGRQKLEDEEGLATLGQNLKELYLAEKDCDVTITVRDVTFKAHRAILGARTPVLEAMFSHSMAESSSGVVCVEDCEPKAFAVFLMFVYSGTIEQLTRENVTDVYYIADKYVLPELKVKSVRYMLSTMAVDSICKIIALAARHGEGELLEKATSFFMENAQEILLTVQWQRFIVENPIQANELHIKTLRCYACDK